MYDNYDDSFGQRIMVARRKRGLSLTQVAERMGVAHQALSEYEHDKKNPRLDTLRRIALAIGCSMSELTGETLAEPELPTANAQLGIMRVERGVDWISISLLSGEFIQIERGCIKNIEMPTEQERKNYSTVARVSTRR